MGDIKKEKIMNKIEQTYVFFSNGAPCMFKITVLLYFYILVTQFDFYVKFCCWFLTVIRRFLLLDNFLTVFSVSNLARIL